MKILFIQLPLIDHGYNYVGGNIAYAAAAISAFLKKNFHVKTSTLPIELSNFGSDKLILKYIKNFNADIIAFSSYLWNIERHLKIAKELKIFKEKTINIFGGPEINDDSFIFEEEHSYVDYFFSGEGEWFFQNYLNKNCFKKYQITKKNNKLIKQPTNELLKSSDIVEPFTSKMLNPLPDGSIFLELTRGCPYKCSYCFYSKNSHKIRETSFQHILDAISMNNYLNLSEIYILSPTFNKTKQFKENLKTLAKLNTEIKLHTEMRAKDIDKDTAKDIYKAGFRSLEVGLQTLNNTALVNIGRHGDITKEIKGIKNLQTANIDIKIGIIPGLPGDNKESFIKTIDKLIDEGFSEEIEFYPLMILPGTKIRSQVKDYNIQFQKKPPYYFIDSNDFNYNDIFLLKDYIEEKTGLYITVNQIPNFINDQNSKYYNSISFNGDNIKNWNADKYNKYIDTNVFSYKIILTEKIDIEFCLNNLLKTYKEGSELFNIIFYSDLFIDEINILNFLNSFESDNFFRRSHLYDEWKSGNRIRFYQVTESVSVFEKFENSYSLIDPILKITSCNYTSCLTYLDQFEEPPNILIDNKIYSLVKNKIAQKYTDYTDRITFMNKEDYINFTKDIKSELIEYAISFNCKSI